MRKLVVSNIMSLDGYYDGPGGDVMVMPMDEAFNAYNAERLRAADTLLVGARSYLGFKGYWPPQADNPDADPVSREIGRRNNAIDKVVVSDTITEDQTDPWRSTTRIVRRADAHAEITELKRQEGREILMFGSRTLWNDLLANGLVDELHLMLGAAVVGGGTPIFGTRPPGPLRLAEARRFDGSDNLVLRYEVGRP
ncbi:MAG: dihydrofolate reductase family protein [Actinomycetota bacterium]|nr:dihydrofolate reductase family protein [Actinomycetota bacterium]